jgi:predicted outer membrane repeat protein
MSPRLKFLIIAVVLLFGFINAIPQVWAAGVVGNGTPGSCTSAALQATINAGNGVITFNCGGAHTITLTSPLNIHPLAASLNITIDGANLITLDGQNTTRIFFQDTWGNNGSTLTLQNLTLTRGRASGSGTAANGGAVQSINQSISLAQRPVLNIHNVTFTNNISNLTSTSGYDFGGAAIYSGAGFVNVTDSEFTDNTATGSSGAAIHILQSGLTIDNTTFTDNTATHQGGTIYIDGLGGASGVFSLTNSIIMGSRSWYSGGAIYVNMYENSSQFTVDRTSFINNGVNGGTRAEGGAICGGSTDSGGSTGNAIIRITNSLFADNFAGVLNSLDGSGGAINFNQRAQVTIANTTFNNNRANGYNNTGNANGGALVIINNTTQFQIINSTISNNFASWLGGGIASSSNGVLKNTILAYNSATGIANFQQHCTTELSEQGFNLQYPGRLTNGNYYNDVTCFAGKSAPNQTNLPEFQDPLLSPLANNGGPTQTRALQTGSPAIDTGNNTICAAAPISNLDQRGMPRPVDGDGLNGAQCDAGAFEFVSNQPPLAFNLNTPANTTGTTTILSWTPSPFATQYHLMVDDDSNFSSPVVDITIPGLTFGPAYIGVNQYYWQVEASNPNGSVTSGPATFTLNSVPAAIPTRNFSAAANQTLTWTPLTWAVGYRVEIALDLAFTNIIETSPDLPAAASSYDTAQEPGIYYWRVTGLRSPGVWGTPSPAEMLTVGSN